VGDQYLHAFADKGLYLGTLQADIPAVDVPINSAERGLFFQLLQDCRIAYVTAMPYLVAFLQKCQKPFIQITMGV